MILDATGAATSPPPRLGIVSKYWRASGFRISAVLTLPMTIKTMSSGR